MTANDNGAIDRLKSDCRALVAALGACDPAAATVATRDTPRPLRKRRRCATAHARTLRGFVWWGFGADDAEALASLRRELVAACADRVTELVAQARALDEEAARSRRTADALSRVVSAAREGAPDAR